MRKFLIVLFLVDFDVLTKQYDKAKKLILKEGIPRFYVKILVQLEDKMIEMLALDKAARKKMSSSNNKSINTMKQKLRKYNKAFEKFLKQYREVPLFIIAFYLTVQSHYVHV